ncbi:hypothetical protein [Uliginosibacterium sediminicola]|uniref:Secreted protein n=1 Tax=Uliginosibacterium sediminicola TaxID=2024550 RepID=A0ABU9YVI0_9RHOO
MISSEALLIALAAIFTRFISSTRRSRGAVETKLRTCRSMTNIKLRAVFMAAADQKKFDFVFRSRLGIVGAPLSARHRPPVWARAYCAAKVEKLCASRYGKQNQSSTKCAAIDFFAFGALVINQLFF